LNEVSNTRVTFEIILYLLEGLDKNSRLTYRKFFYLDIIVSDVFRLGLGNRKSLQNYFEGFLCIVKEVD